MYNLFHTYLLYLEHPCQKRFTRTENKVEMIEVDKVEHLTSDEDFIPLPVPKGIKTLLNEV